jgi:hypothetical protein
MGPQHSGSLSAIDSSICGSDFIKTKGYQRSKVGRWSRRGRLRWGRWGGDAPQPRQRLTGAGHSSCYGHHFRWGLTLRTRRNEGSSASGLSAARATVVGRVMAVGLHQPLASSMTSSNGRPATRLGYVGATWRVEGWHGIGSAWWGLCHTPFRDSGNEASIRVPRMFHSHV